MEWYWGILGGIVVVAIVAGIYLRAGYTRLVRLAGQVDADWEEVADRLHRRAELLPGLMSTVQGYAAHEKAVFAQVDAARHDALEAAAPGRSAAAETAVRAALRALLGVAEAYPQLQASPEFLQAQGRIVAAEDEIQSARRAYNGSVREFNARLASFPSRLFARRLGYVPRAFFELGAGVVAEPPRVQF